jgi:hypothetical protein
LARQVNADGEGKFEIGDLKFQKVHGARGAPLQTPAFSVSSTESFSMNAGLGKTHGDVFDGSSW